MSRMYAYRSTEMKTTNKTITLTIRKRLFEIDSRYEKHAEHRILS